MFEKNHNSDTERNRKRGFSLIELLIVVAIILIIAAIAIEHRSFTCRRPPDDHFSCSHENQFRQDLNRH